jgi:hypothetical protein
MNWAPTSHAISFNTGDSFVPKGTVATNVPDAHVLFPVARVRCIFCLRCGRMKRVEEDKKLLCLLMIVSRSELGECIDQDEKRRICSKCQSPDICFLHLDNSSPIDIIREPKMKLAIPSRKHHGTESQRSPWKFYFHRKGKHV